MNQLLNAMVVLFSILLIYIAIRSYVIRLVAWTIVLIEWLGCSLDVSHQWAKLEAEWRQCVKCNVTQICKDTGKVFFEDTPIMIWLYKCYYHHTRLKDSQNLGNFDGQ